jgi:hypothetical protein
MHCMPWHCCRGSGHRGVGTSHHVGSIAQTTVHRSQVPRQLVDAVFPFLEALEAKVLEMGADASPSHRVWPGLLYYLAVVLIQDALEMAEGYPDNPVHAMLLETDAFK